MRLPRPGTAEARGSRSLDPSAVGPASGAAPVLERTAKVLPYLVVLGLAVLVAAPLVAALGSASAGGGPAASFRAELRNPTTLRALAFALKEALASTVLALLIGIPGAYIVARLEFRGRRFLKALSAIPFCVPPILVVLAFVLYYGRGGLLNRGLMALFGLAEPPLTFLYSFTGLVLVHGFYNFPIVLQGLSAVWETLPRDREEAARSLGAGPLEAFRQGSLPALMPALVQASSLVFLFCFFSFVVVLVFGPLGGSTLEVEIYRASRLEGSPARAGALALLETGVALGVLGLFTLLEGSRKASLRKAGGRPRRHKPRGGERLALGAYLLVLALGFGGPLACLVGEAFVARGSLGGAGQFGLGNFRRLLGSGALGGALGDSLSVALPAAALALGLGTLIALSFRSSRLRAAGEAVMSLPLAVSGVVTALGWTLLSGGEGTRPLLVLILGLTALPFTARSVRAALESLEARPREAARTLGAGRARAVLDADLGAARPALLQAGAFAFSMAVGDANAALVAGVEGFSPLPLLIYRLIGAYRFPEACAAGLLLACLTGLVFFAKDARHGT